MILLDTCVFLWLDSQPSLLSNVATAALIESENVYGSPLTAYEIGLKVARGMIKFRKPLNEVLISVRERHRIKELPLSSSLCAAAALLPPIHKDPFDRVLIATAIEHQLILLTPDRHIAQYSEVRVIW